MTEQEPIFAPLPVDPRSGKGIHPYFKNITDRVFGRLRVLGYAGPLPHGTKGHTLASWWCRCTCGAIHRAKGAQLLAGDVASCGCYRADSLVARALDLAGRRFARLLVLAFDGRDSMGNYLWRCRCDCGNTKVVATHALRSGNTVSCGCWGRTNRAVRQTTHGHSKGGKTPEYRSWRHMIHRCENPDDRAWRHYGGRGIKVCEAWRGSFERFLADVGPCPSPAHSLDRIDPDGPYCADNVRWATDAEQARHRRNNVLVSWEGETLCAADFAAKLGIPRKRVYKQLGRGKTAGEIAALAVAKKPKAKRHIARGWANDHPDHQCWAHMVRRCHCPRSESYAVYGGRGLHVCASWRRRKGFWTFLRDMGPRPSLKHTIGRIDNERGYDCGQLTCEDCQARGASPNCRWETRAEQNRNTSRNRFLTYQGETLCIADWTVRTGLKHNTIVQRLDMYGWTVERALTEPVRRGNATANSPGPSAAR